MVWFISINFIKCSLSKKPLGSHSSEIIIRTVISFILFIVDILTMNEILDKCNSIDDNLHCYLTSSIYLFASNNSHIVSILERRYAKHSSRCQGLICWMFYVQISFLIYEGHHSATAKFLCCAIYSFDFPQITKYLGLLLPFAVFIFLICE